MSSDASQGSGNRRLLTKVQHSIPPGMLCRVVPDMGRRKNVIDPLVVECCSSPRISFALAFDTVSKSEDGSYSLVVKLRDVHTPPNMTLEFEATVETYWRPKDVDVSLETDKSLWTEIRRLNKYTVIGGGAICHHKTFRHLRSQTVHLEVYAVGDPKCRGDLPGSLNALRLNKTLSDVELKVDGEVFPAHRAVLAASSPVFCSMFTSGLKEAQEGVVEVQGTSSKAFGLFLEFLYKADVDNWKGCDGCELEVLELADRYLVDHIKVVCQERLLSLPHLALTVLQQAANKPVISSELRAKAVRVVMKSWSAVSGTQQWEDFEASQPVAADLLRAQQKAELS